MVNAKTPFGVTSGIILSESKLYERMSVTHLNDTMLTNLLATHRKYAHLTKEERVMIATLKSQGLSNRAIGRQLGVNHQTIK